MTSLAYTPKNTPNEPVSLGSSEPKKPQFPTLRLNGHQAEAAGLMSCKLGDEYEITLRIKARQLGGSEYEMTDGKGPAEFDVISAGEPVEVESEGEDMEEGSEEEEMKPKPTPKKLKGVKSPKESGIKDAYAEDED